MHTPQMRTLYNHFLLYVIGNDTLAKRLNDNDLHTLHASARAHKRISYNILMLIPRLCVFIMRSSHHGYTTL